MNIVFVTGTGRCGKSVVAGCLADNPRTAKLPFELRFLFDPDGIIPFYATMRHAWNPHVADLALERLIVLLSKTGYKSHKGPYRDWDLVSVFPAWHNAAHQLIDNLSLFEYNCRWYGSENDKEIMTVTYPALALREFIYTVLESYGDYDAFVLDETWAALHTTELLSLLPDAKILHVVRDPRDVVCSMMEQRWCPSDMGQAIDYYDALMSGIVKETKRKAPYVKFEDIVISGGNIIKDLSQALYLPTGSIEHIDTTKAHTERWKQKTVAEQNKLNGGLSYWIDYWGYSQ